MRILVSCVPFDHGRSGISVYTRHTVAALAAAASIRPAASPGG